MLYFNRVKTKLLLKSGMSRFCLLIVLSAVCVLFTVTRQIITGKPTYNFLYKNLLLAAVPWFISLIVSTKFIAEKPKILTVALFIIWLLFFPNGPYIITDLYYLKNHPERMFWYDLIMLLLFSWTGLLFGFFSMDGMIEILNKKSSKVKKILVPCGLLFLCAFGIYLGRDLRWHSWEIFLAPRKFFQDIIDRFFNPIGHRRTWGFTFLVGIFLNIIYWTLKIIRKNDKSIDSCSGSRGNATP